MIDGPPGGPQVVKDRVERALHERVEPLRRLVEDGELRVVLEGLDDAQLLAHPTGVVADLAAQGGGPQLQPIEELRAAARGPPGQGGEVIEQALPGQPVPEGDAARQVADAAPDLDGTASDVVPEDGRCP